jgi:hypothetical protein
LRVYGLDFTSRPSARKAITCAVCQPGKRLRLESIERFTRFIEFEDFLRRSGPWLAGMDFPFGQPRRLIANLGWPADWQACVHHIRTLGEAGFASALDAYRAGRPAGDKQHRRQTDALACACSPMMLYGVPVAKMFFAGAPRLADSAVSILPCRPTADNRIVIETYPALAARGWLGRTPYKADGPAGRTPARRAARERLVEAVTTAAHGRYGTRMELSTTQVQELIEDASGDSLDALLCALQATWALCRTDYGVPAGADSLEGWIVDPLLMPAA